MLKNQLIINYIIQKKNVRVKDSLQKADQSPIITIQ